MEGLLSTGPTVFDSKYFQPIQAAVGSEKNLSTMFKYNLFLFLGLLVSCDKKTKVKGNEKFTIEKRPQKFGRINRQGL